MERMLQVTHRRRMLANVPWAAARMLGRIGQILPSGPITLDQVRMLRFDNVVSADAKRDNRTLEGLGINPTALEIVLPTYLTRFREQGEFTQARSTS
jgi:NADH dehydrogenase